MELSIHFFTLLALLGTYIFPHSVSVLPSSLTTVPIVEENALVYDENNNGGADLEGDTWVFDKDNNGGADLIIRFRREPALTAYLYDDTNANKQVDYVVGDNEIKVLESNWRVKVVSRTNQWTLPNGLPDWNLDLEIDSGFSFQGGVESIPRLSGCWQGVRATAIELFDKNEDEAHGTTAIDGKVDFLVSYWGTTSDGVPAYEWRNVQEGSSYDAIIVNANPDLKYQITHRFPLLDTTLYMNWSNARIHYLRALVPARTNERGYFILFNKTSETSKTAFGFENPFAFYDLQNDKDCVSELKLRTVVEDYDSKGTGLIAYNEIRYSWAQRDNSMRYRLYFIGQEFLKRLINYQPYPVSHIPYEELPSFVLNHPWRGVSFAEYEGIKPGSFTEGIYENLYYTPALRNALLSGRELKLQPYLPFYLFLREEYDLTGYNQIPVLYFSPIDKRLHLFAAKQGILIYSADTSDAPDGFSFNADKLRDGSLTLYDYSTYSDSDLDGYVDTWSYFKNNQLNQQLVIRPTAAVLFKDNTLIIKRLPADFTPFSWKSAPPSTTSEWQMFEDRLTAIEPERKPLSDLLSIFNALPGETSSLPNTLLTSTSDGKNFSAQIITLGLSKTQSGFIQLPEDSLPAGNYALLLKENGWQIENLTAPQLKLSELTLSPTEDTTSLDQRHLTFTIENPGNVDVLTTIRVTDTQSNGTDIIYKEEKKIAAGNSRSIDLVWSPTLNGNHELKSEVLYTSDNLQSLNVIEKKLTININNGILPEENFNLKISNNVTLIIIIIGFLFFIISGIYGAYHAFQE